MQLPEGLGGAQLIHMRHYWFAPLAAVAKVDREESADGRHLQLREREHKSITIGVEGEPIHTMATRDDELSGGPICMYVRAHVYVYTRVATSLGDPRSHLVRVIGGW